MALFLLEATLRHMEDRVVIQDNQQGNSTLVTQDKCFVLFWSAHCRKEKNMLQWAQKKATKNIRGVEHLSYKEML